MRHNVSMRNTTRGEARWGTFLILGTVALLTIGGVQYVKGKVTAREAAEDMRSEVIMSAADHADLDSIYAAVESIARDKGVQYEEDDFVLETGDQETVHLAFHGTVRTKALFLTFQFPVDVDATGSGRLGVIGGDSGEAGGAMKSGLRGIQKAKDIRDQANESNAETNAASDTGD